MPLTNFPFGITSFGYPIMPPVPFSGDSIYYYVDVVNGNDGNSGTDPSQALKTIAKGYTLLRAGHYDTLFVIGLGTAFTLTAALVWAKDYTNLVGITAPIHVSQRARITSGTATISPMITFSGTGINVQNIQLAQFGSDATLSAIDVTVSGQRCNFQNVQFAGGGNATVRAGTAMRSLVISGGGGENNFENCTIGLDTVDNAGVNYELEFSGGSPRNVFTRCAFIKRVVAGGEGGGFVKIGTDGIDRWVRFDRCFFTNSTVGGGAVQTAAFSAGTALATGGLVILSQCLTGGTTGWTGASNTSLSVDNAYAAATSGIGLTPTS
jgi:hypothetical protein